MEKGEFSEVYEDVADSEKVDEETGVDSAEGEGEDSLESQEHIRLPELQVQHWLTGTDASIHTHTHILFTHTHPPRDHVSPFNVSL